MASTVRIRTQLYVVVAVAAFIGAGFVMGQRGCEERPVKISYGRVPKVKVDVLKSGAGAPIVEGKRIELHYTLKLTDGTVILDTRSKERTHKMYVGDGTVIEGLDEGIRGMRLGEIRRITIPPELAYGRPGYAAGKIPANEKVIMDVELAAVN